jgi:hypothetical protein
VGTNRSARRARQIGVKAIAYFRTSSATNVGEDKDALKRGGVSLAGLTWRLALSFEDFRDFIPDVAQNVLYLPFLRPRDGASGTNAA